MHFLEYHYKKVVRYDLINKFQYTNIDELPQIKKIIINFGCKDFKIKNFAATLLALELITTQRGIVTKTKTPNIFIKISSKSHVFQLAFVLASTNHLVSFPCTRK